MRNRFLSPVPSLFEDFDHFFSANMPNDYFLDEDPQGYSLSVDMPGIKKEDLKIEIKGNAIVIEAESKGKKHRKYSRVFSVPTKVEMEKIEADLKDGVLTIGMPKVEEKSKLIQIK